MADNTRVLVAATGDDIASDDVGGIKYQRVKVNYGVDGSATDVSAAFPLPVTLPLGPFGQYNVTADPTVMFYDTFEGSTFDTTNRWTNYGGSIFQSGGACTINPGTSANSGVAAISQTTIAINTVVVVAGLVKFESGTTATGNHRFWGLGTPANSLGTAAAPLTDAIGFEVDTSGVLRASIYAAGTRVFTQTLTMSTDGLFHLFMIQARGDSIYFYKDNPQVPVANNLSFDIGSSSQLLPMRMASLNGNATTVGTPTMAVQGLTILDQSRQASQLADGTFPWRKARIDSAGGLNVAVQAATITGNGPTSVTAAAADTLLLAANTSRRGATCTNDSTAVLYLSLGTATASATAYTVKLAAGGYYEVPFGYTGQVRGIWAAANGAARITEVAA